ncbi:helix-turn-helix domain-containing protein [Brevibacillus borstelensis]|uniref:helix-turn-helix domain-containing protein n=1 Tax=Brevibacillus borstelensis TaxID=45462 RepID=UPI000468A525|nr:helix-turn-helix transcriptional regulator [Brevibacillus borstelensis]MCC0567484.1 helix-turn-helix domain-containing protein [Brevibacillus borstelensis]MCM3473654.1 helix-turn-helix domain-containing protein [Brevibacillus borstelensis]MCM3561916.1 helix-turn-helix domain-containing protein [Brevibacillus borstelensis]MCM3594023.1 helix-turn-helix domain-containing protein [Brevibacillus borstelensis]MED1853574.1 helix-turn-helix transcriptional regulator [Brevibacillus borstelensis]
MSNTLSYIGQKIRENRINQNITQADLATKSNLTINTISQVELGNANISINKLESICLALRIDLVDVIPGQYSSKERNNTDIEAQKNNSSENEELIIHITRLCRNRNKRDLEIVIGLLEVMSRSND